LPYNEANLEILSHIGMTIACMLNQNATRSIITIIIDALHFDPTYKQYRIVRKRINSHLLLVQADESILIQDAVRGEERILGTLQDLLRYFEV
jgi:hypothetical protein